MISDRLLEPLDESELEVWESNGLQRRKQKDRLAVLLPSFEYQIMRLNRFNFATLLGIALSLSATAASAPDPTPMVAVGPQYGSTHVYVAREDVDRFVASFLATFGGQGTKPVVTTVTPTPSSMFSELLKTPVGMVSLFGFKTPIPYPFGAERTGYLVTDMDAAVAAARVAGADVLVTPFPDPIGRDAVIQWPGGVDMQLYWHTATPSYPPLQTVPENRVYLPADRVAAFVAGFIAFSHGTVTSDVPNAPGIEIGRSSDTHRRVRIDSAFGRMTLFVTDGHLPFPYGQEITGYEVGNLADTLAKAKAAGVELLVQPYSADHRESAMVRFPGGYIAEIHEAAGQ